MFDQLIHFFTTPDKAWSLVSLPFAVAFVLFFGGGSYIIQEVVSRYDVGKYLSKLGMEDIAESLGIEIETTAAREDTSGDDEDGEEETAHIIYETDGAEDDAEEEAEAETE